MCKLSGNLQWRRGKKSVFAITENRGFIFRVDGIIIIRSASYLCTRGRVIDFNDSFFSQLNPLSLSILSEWWRWSVKDQIPAPAFDQILSLRSKTWRRLSFFLHTAAYLLFFFCDYSAEQTLHQNMHHAGSVLFTFFVSLLFFSFHPILQTPSPCFHPASHFILLFFCCWWKDSRRNRMGRMWSP